VATTQDVWQIAYEQTPRYENAPSISPYSVSTAVRYQAVQSARLSPAPQFASRADEMRGIEGSVPDLLDGYAPAGDTTIRAYANDLIFLLGLAGFFATVTAGSGVLDQWTITTTGVPTGGTFTIQITQATVLSGGPVTTASIPYAATAAQMQSILTSALQPYGVFVSCSGGPLPTGIVATLSGAGGGYPFTLALGTNALTGGATPAPSFVHTTTGAAGGSLQLPDLSYLPTGVNAWQFAKRTGLTAKTAQIQAVYSDELVYLLGQGYGVSALSMNAAGALSVTWLGLVLKRLLSDPNISPSYDTQAIPHFRQGDILLSWLAGSGVTSDFTWAIANPLTPVRTLGLASYYPNMMEQGPARVSITGTIPKFVLDPDDIDALLAGQSFPATVSWKSPKTIGATNTPYSMFLQLAAAQITGGDADPIANVRRYGATFNWQAAWDETAGFDAKFTILSNLSATGVASAGVGL
jgi:hypothetical protein